MSENNNIEQQSPPRTWIDKITQVFNVEPKNRSQLIDILRDARQRNLLDTNILNMIEGVLNVEESRVKDVMIPRSQMITLNKDLPLEDIIPLVVQSGHSRFPVIGDNKDEVLGILLAKDLLSFSFNNQTPLQINNILRPAVFIPESKRLDVLLQDFRVNRSHIAIVVDEYGGITGLITIEDVLEEIVGDIEDEFDVNDSPLIKKEEQNKYVIKALTPIETFNEYFHTSLKEEEVETVGGLVMRKMGRLPKRGETVIIDPFTIHILRADSRRIHALQISLQPEQQEHFSH